MKSGGLVLGLDVGVWRHVQEHQQSKSETTLESDFLERKRYATRKSVDLDLRRIIKKWIVLELDASIWQHVLKHQQSKSETTPESDFLEMLEWATR